MAQKTKTMLTRAERERIKKANTERLRVVRGKKEKKMSRKDGDGDNKDEKEQGVESGKG